MVKISIIVIILFGTFNFVFSQNPKSTFYYKSIRIVNGDTIVEEKNVESDDPNFSFSDSLIGGGFSIHSGKSVSPELMFPDFGINPMQPFQSPFFNDTIFNSFFHQPMMDSALLRQYFPELNIENFETPHTIIPENNLQQDILVDFVEGTDLMNISFELSLEFETNLKIINEQNEVIFEENFDKSSAYFVKQIDISNFLEGEYTILINRGDLQKSNRIRIGK